MSGDSVEADVEGERDISFARPIARRRKTSSRAVTIGVADESYPHKRVVIRQTNATG